MHHRHDLLPALAVAVMIGVSGCGKRDAKPAVTTAQEPPAQQIVPVSATQAPLPAEVEAADKGPVGTQTAPTTTASDGTVVLLPAGEPSSEVATVIVDVREKLNTQQYMAAAVTLQTFIATKKISDDDKVRLYLLLDEFKATVTAEASLFGGKGKPPATGNVNAPSPAKATAELPASATHKETGETVRD